MSNLEGRMLELRVLYNQDPALLNNQTDKFNPESVESKQIWIRNQNNNQQFSNNIGRSYLRHTKNVDSNNINQIIF